MSRRSCSSGTDSWLLPSGFRGVWLDALRHGIDGSFHFSLLVYSSM